MIYTIYSGVRLSLRKLDFSPVLGSTCVYGVRANLEAPRPQEMCSVHVVFSHKKVTKRWGSADFNQAGARTLKINVNEVPSTRTYRLK